MPFSDLDVWLRAGQAIMQGRDPYALPGVYYPLPFLLIFVPLAGLPPDTAHVVWSLIGIATLVGVLRRRALSVLLFMPVVLTFVMGQAVMPFLALFALLRAKRHSGIALGVLALKPQLVLLLGPWQVWQWWRGERKQMAWCALTIAALCAAAFAVQPDWSVRWLAVSGERNRAAISPSLWGLLSFLPGPLWISVAAAIGAAVVLLVWRTRDIDKVMAASLFVNPLIISYDLTLLTPMLPTVSLGLALSVLSWLTFAASAWQLNEGAVSALTLVVLAALVRGGAGTRVGSKARAAGGAA